MAVVSRGLNVLTLSHVILKIRIMIEELRNEADNRLFEHDFRVSVQCIGTTVTIRSLTDL